MASLGASAESLVGLEVVGDSMQPELLDGDVVLVNTYLERSVQLEPDIYVFRLGEELLIKRLVPDGQGGAVAHSTNLAYAPIPLPEDLPEGSFQIVGRLAVRWRQVR